jgi:hypothetical protein
MRLASLAVSLLALLVAVSPAAADPKGDHPGNHGQGIGHHDQGDGPRGSNDGPRGVSFEDGPGNSFASHWCQTHFNDNEANWQFVNRGECVAFFARRQHDNDDDDTTRPVSLNFGDLTIADTRVRHDGTFRVRGFGAESTVQVWITGGSGLVVGFGQADPANDGTFTVEGRWACQDDHDPHEARFRAQDDNELDTERATFPCDDLHT